MKLNKFFGIIKMSVGILLALAILFSLVFELLTHYYFNKSEYLYYYQLMPNYITFFMNFTASMGAIVTSLVAFYYAYSGWNEFTDKEPIYLLVRILVNSVPSILFSYLSFLVFYTLFFSHQASNWSSFQKIFFPVFVPFLTFLFIREFFLSKKEIS